MSSDGENDILPTDPYEFLDLILNPDGTTTRKPSKFPVSPPQPHLTDQTQVLSRDLTINQSSGTWARFYLPRVALDCPSNLPLIVYYHGGGFVFTTAAVSVNHEFCLNLALHIPAVVVSVDYRSAPEHRLPAAYHDAMEALYWIKTVEDDWLKKHADLTKTFIMGSSSGANIAYHVGLYVADADVEDLKPLNINGLILQCPFLGGSEKTSSEMRLVNNPVSALNVTDALWKLALPIGANRDHEYCNPMVNGGSNILEKIERLSWKVFVSGSEGDPFFDRQIELATMIERKGIRVVRHFDPQVDHGADVSDPVKRDLLFGVVKSFIFSSNY